MTAQPRSAGEMTGDRGRLGGRWARIGRRTSWRFAQPPLLPGDARIDGDAPVEADSTPGPGAALPGVEGQFEHVGMLSGHPMNHLLLFFGQRELNRWFAAAHGHLRVGTAHVSEVRSETVCG